MITELGNVTEATRNTTHGIGLDAAFETRPD
jgi:hypothetical protein